MRLDWTFRFAWHPFTDISLTHTHTHTPIRQCSEVARAELSLGIHPILTDMSLNYVQTSVQTVSVFMCIKNGEEALDKPKQWEGRVQGSAT